MTLTLKPETEAHLLAAAARRGLPAEAVVDALLTEYEEAQEVGHIAHSPTPEELGWPPGFFEETYGSLQDETLERLPQGNFEEREPIH